MISISDNSRVKVKNESIYKVTKLLKKLDGIDQVKVCHQNEIGDIYFEQLTKDKNGATQ